MILRTIPGGVLMDAFFVRFEIVVSWVVGASRTSRPNNPHKPYLADVSESGVCVDVWLAAIHCPAKRFTTAYLDGAVQQPIRIVAVHRFGHYNPDLPIEQHIAVIACCDFDTSGSNYLAAGFIHVFFSER